MEMPETNYALLRTTDGRTVVMWRDNEGIETAEVDENSPEVSTAIQAIRTVIWGG